MRCLAIVLPHRATSLTCRLFRLRSDPAQETGRSAAATALLAPAAAPEWVTASEMIVGGEVRVSRTAVMLLP